MSRRGLSYDQGEECGNLLQDGEEAYPVAPFNLYYTAGKVC